MRASDPELDMRTGNLKSRSPVMPASPCPDPSIPFLIGGPSEELEGLSGRDCRVMKREEVGGKSAFNYLMAVTGLRSLKT